MIEISVFSVLLLLFFIIIQFQLNQLGKRVEKNGIKKENPLSVEKEPQKTPPVEPKKKKLLTLFSNVLSPEVKENMTEWVIPHASVIGLQHLQSKDPSPCQDSHGIKMIDGESGIAVVCDGAGSAKNSDKGSQFVVKKTLSTFSQIISDNKWSNTKLPKEKEWKAASLKGFNKIRHDLELYAEELECETKSLACTIIAVIFFKDSLLFAHIGDGRAAYQNKNGEWKSILNPHKGEEANQTIFITSDAWLIKDFEMKGIPVPETLIVKETIDAFVLMSDGLESHSFELGFFDEENQVFVEKNEPYAKFFNPLKETVLKMKAEGFSFEEIQDKWQGFLEKGTERIKNEPDDKTLILGIKT